MKTTTNLAYWHAMIFAAVSLVPWWPAFGEVLTPGWGPPGTQVVVKIDGLDSEAVTAVMIGEVAAPITARGAGTVTISIPAGAASGVVTLSLGEEMITTPVSLEVTRLIPLNIGAGFSQITAGGSLFGDAVAGQVQVAVGRATLVFASNGGEGPALFGIVTDAHGSLTLDAATTAQAVVFLSSPVFTADSAEAVNRLQTLASLTELGALTATVETEVQAGRDYSALPEFGDALEAALMAYLALPTITPQPAWPHSPSIAISEAARVSSGTGGYVRRDLKAPGFEK